VPSREESEKQRERERERERSGDLGIDLLRASLDGDRLVPIPPPESNKVSRYRQGDVEESCEIRHERNDYPE